ncbi:MAG: Nif3-like dinuclear metal center hexameric protein [Planctomycetia bacterium]|nr:Nif3-like dinuclear metal center hexameric protein [Planctomycetia bacterium]
MRVSDICDFMREFAPPALSESWDNTGLLLGDPAEEIQRLMTCLTLTPETVGEAVREKADMIISHHPMPFRPVSQITSENSVGRILRELIRADIALYSPHTSFDSASRGINQQIAEGLRLTGITSLLPCEMKKQTEEYQHSVPGSHAEYSVVGTGRIGSFPEPITLQTCLRIVKTFFALPYVQYVGDLKQKVQKIAVGCGAAGDFLRHAVRENCDLFLTGETNYHTQLEAKASGVSLILMTHFASERFACLNLAAILRERFPNLQYVWGSQEESDPLHTFF